jgi:hypothetical protein
VYVRHKWMAVPFVWGVVRHISYDDGHDDRDCKGHVFLVEGLHNGLKSFTDWRAENTYEVDASGNNINAAGPA